MKKLRPFLALLLVCWLLAVPALAVDEAGGAPDDAPPVSDDVSGDTSVPETEAPALDADSPDEAPAPPENNSPDEDAPPPADDAPDTSDDTHSFPADTPPPSETPPPVVEDTPPAADPVSVDPTPETPSEVPTVSSGGSVPVPDPPEYPVLDTPTVISGLQEVPAGVYDTATVNAPSAETPQVFTISAIPEFSLAANEPDADNTMSQAVRALFGTYTPRVQTVATYYNGEQIAVEEQYVPGLAGLDWEWLAGFAVFCLMLYCLFRLLGGSVKYG